MVHPDGLQILIALDQLVNAVFGGFADEMMKVMGLVNPSNNMIDLEMAKGVIKAAFDKQPTVEYYGFKFDKADGDALINIMEKYNGD